MRASHLLVSKLVVSGAVAAIEMVSSRSEDVETKPSRGSVVVGKCCFLRTVAQAWETGV